VDFDSFLVFMHLFRSKKILKGHLQPKFKEPLFGPLMHAIKWLQAEYVMCTGTVEKIDQSQLQ